ncbi:LysR family transcriptional regulator [uncultured Roseobacter sp.]|uniref:LysR family transcriptional regulator n=1 Tax=uncultured Roseobacter sp. TaxID=114847 RepID=UPI00262F695F|nr:LysR family transcriptional regulator [uncultured Roseobacter sp.]
MENLESDLLRTFVAVAQAGSVTDGAARICRSQSATSIQIKRLEAVLGRPVF